MNKVEKRYEHKLTLDMITFQRNQEKISVEDESDYKYILSKLKVDFEKRYNIITASPKTGLDGFERICSIGRGSFGTVDFIRDSIGHVYAVKIIQKEFTVVTKKVSSFINEKRLMSAFRFPFLIWLEWSRKDFENLYLGMPVLHGGDLFLLYSRYKHFSEHDARFYAAQVCLALEYLHYLRIAYRDLKLENIMIDRSGFIRLVDFGSSKIVEDRTMTLCGTPEYMAPEVILGTPYFSGPDWWAFGVLIFEMVFGSTPFSSQCTDIGALYENISNGSYKMPAKFSENLKNLVQNFLVVNFTNRLGCRFDGADEVRRHPWFSSIDWVSYLRKQVSPPFVPTISFDADTRYLKVSKEKKEYSKPKLSFSKEFAEF